MTEEPENIVLKQLSILRGEMQEGFAVLNKNVGALAQTLVGVQRDIRALQRDVGSLKDSVATLGIAVDEHSRRLDRIEQHLNIGHA